MLKSGRVASENGFVNVNRLILVEDVKIIKGRIYPVYIHVFYKKLFIGLGLNFISILMIGNSKADFVVME